MKVYAYAIGLGKFKFGDLAIDFGEGADDGEPRSEVADVLGHGGLQQDALAVVEDEGLALFDFEVVGATLVVFGLHYESFARRALTWASSSAMRSASVLMGSGVK